MLTSQQASRAGDERGASGEVVSSGEGGHGTLLFSTQLSAVRHDHGARDERGAGGGEKGDNVGNLFGLAKPAHRHLASEHLVHGGFVFGEFARPGAVGAKNLPGATALMRMPSSASGRARPRTVAFKAAFAAE